jgi:hypothetical protein
MICSSIIVDDFTRECLTLVADTSLPGLRVDPEFYLPPWETYDEMKKSVTWKSAEALQVRGRRS